MVAQKTLIRIFKEGHLKIDTSGSDMATESTQSSIKSQTDKLNYDVSNNLKINISADDIGVAKSSDISTDQPRHITNAYDTPNDRFKIDAQVVANPSNLDVALSTRASETTVSNILTKLSDVQNPVPINLDSVYSEDIDTSNSDIGTFTFPSINGLILIKFK